MSNSTPNNGGLPPQKISGLPPRQGAIQAQQAGDNKQLKLINPTGGRRRKRKKQYFKGGTGSSPTPITPPVVPNTGGSSDTRGEQQTLYNKMASLSGGVQENSKYDNAKVGGKRRKTRTKRFRKIKKTKTLKSKKYTKRRKY